MRPEHVRLSRLHERVLLGALGSTAVSGAAWLVFHYFLRVEGEFGDVAHPLEAWSLALHGAAGMIALLALGSIVRGHVMNGWKSQRNRVSGGLLTGVALIVIATGWALYYSGNETLRALIGPGHWATGILGALLLPLHRALGRAVHGSSKKL